MSQDVFAREVKLGGAFSADGTQITFSNSGVGLLIQRLQYRYQQSISRVNEIGSSDVYLVAGRTQGQLTIARVLGPTVLMVDFYKKFGDACAAASNHLQFKATVGCGQSSSSGSTQQQIEMRHCVITDLGGTIQSQDMLLNEDCNMMFLYMTLA